MTILNLQKNDILDLTKKNPSLNNLIVGTGWDVVKPKGLFGGLFGSGSDYDLDLFALKLDSEGKLMSKGIVYFGAKIHEGIHSTGDNLTGEGEGDDEQIIVELSKIPEKYDKIILVVNIYDAYKRKQHFGMIKNAFIRLVDERDGKEVCRYNLSESYDNMTAMVFGEVYRHNGEWKFNAVGQGTKDEGLGQLAQRYT